MKIYKLTDQNDQTYNKCQWGEGITVTTSGKGPLCGLGWTHWYTNPLLAVLLNPIHARIDLSLAHLWEGEGIPEKFDHGLKVGCKKATTFKRIPLPEILLTQRIAFGIICAKESYPDLDWNKWAADWLSGRDRTKTAAKTAEASVKVSAWAAARWAAEASARWAAEASARAAEASARAATDENRELDLIRLAQEAITF